MCLGTAIAIGHLAGFVGVLFIFVSFWVKLADEETLMLRTLSGQIRRLPATREAHHSVCALNQPAAWFGKHCLLLACSALRYSPFSIKEPEWSDVTV